MQCISSWPFDDVRCWTYETSLLTGTELSDTLPNTEYQVPQRTLDKHTMRDKFRVILVANLSYILKYKSGTKISIPKRIYLD